MKTILILVDGMRPDVLDEVESAQKMIKESSSTMNAATVFPSVTLPCHVSLFHSVDPSRHGTTTNDYTPQVRPINGLCEVLKNNGKKCAFFYNWEWLRDLSRPGSLTHSYFLKGRLLGYDKGNDIVTDNAISYLKENETDFSFVYLGYCDAAGHDHGWLTPQYMDSIENSWENINKICKEFKDDYTIIVTADHGGHERTHGTKLPEDMLIPIIIKGKDFAAGSQIFDANIKDIAPTIVDIFGIEPDGEWEGKSLINRA